MNYDIKIPGKGTLVFKPERAKEVGKRIIEIYHNPNSIMGRTIPPQIANFPIFLDNDPKGAAHYLMTLAMTDYQTESDKLYPNICKMVNKEYKSGNGFIFDPTFIATNFQTKKEVKTFYENLGSIIAPHAKYRYLLENAITLQQEFDGDVRNIIESTGKKTLESELAIQKHLKGFGEGTTPLFLKYCMQRKLIDFIDPEELLVKVDVHKLRFPFAMQLFDFEETHKGSFWEIDNSNTKLINGFKEIYKYMATSNAKNNKQAVNNLQAIDETVWRLSTDICRNKNINLCQDQCPILNSCSGLPYSISGKASPKKRKEKDRIKANEESIGTNQELFGVLPITRNPKREELHQNTRMFYDRKTKKFHIAQGWRTIYPKVDCREGEKNTSEQKRLFDF
ncbi:MAG: hypothetical protein PF569_08155 [Candidatus Woesearchaeota archaeon]|jgi:hypothetical protein|nr:hypothetical protein [Candidatus Woesearchaeota archaeon]